MRNRRADFFNVATHLNTLLGKIPRLVRKLRTVKIWGVEEGFKQGNTITGEKLAFGRQFQRFWGKISHKSLADMWHAFCCSHEYPSLLLYAQKQWLFACLTDSFKFQQSVHTNNTNNNTRCGSVIHTETLLFLHLLSKQSCSSLDLLLHQLQAGLGHQKSCQLKGVCFYSIHACVARLI